MSRMIVLVAGLPGSGKSFFSKKLAEELDAIYINSDKVRLSLHASGKYSMEDRLLVYKEMLVRTSKALEENRVVIADATFFHHTMREMFLRLAEGFHVKIRVIEVIADEDLVRQRLSEPREYSEADFSVYEKVRDDFEEITMPHLTLKSTNDNLNAMLKAAISYINSEGE